MLPDDSTLPTPPHGDDELIAGTVVGSWRVERELGRGGMGTVYAVRHVDIGKAAALKVVHRDMLGESFEASDVLTEARAVNAFSHPNVVDIFESGMMVDGRPFLVMERLRGRTLGDRHAESRVPALEAIDYLIPVCDALAAAHAAGIVHRDIKLDNIFLSEDRGTKPGVRGTTIVKLVDWGVASITDPGGRSGDSLTIGTPRYVAPEQIKGEGVTAASDIYALGVVAYELFLEEPPFNATTTAELLLAHVNDAPPAPKDVWPRIPAKLDALLMSMLAKDPADRPSAVQVADTLHEVRSELRQALTAASAIRVRARTAGPRGTDPTLPGIELAQGRRWRWFAAAAAIVSVLGVRALLTSDAGAAAAPVVAQPSPSPVPVAATPGVASALPAQADQDDDARPTLATAPRSPSAAARPTRQGAPSPAVSPARPTSKPIARTTAKRRLHPDTLIEPY
jgi:tRNA A-37 threonylcarbamoyl transferase component Bud32